jgi:TonB family protein
MADIFVSYSRRDSGIVEEMIAELQRLKISVYQDKKGLGSGKGITKQLADQIERARCVLVCWSPAAADSDWVNSEAERGRDGRKLACVVVEGDEHFRPPMPFDNVQWEDLRRWTPSEDSVPWRKVLGRIGDLCERHDLSEWSQLFDADAPTLEAWLQKYDGSSPLSSIVNDAYNKRLKLEQEQRLAEARRKQELAASQKADAERVAAEEQKTAEQQRAAREAEAKAKQARAEREEAQRRFAQERAAETEEELRLQKERIKLLDDAVRERELQAQREHERVRELEESSQALKEAIERKQKAEAENRRMENLLKATSSVPPRPSWTPSRDDAYDASDDYRDSSSSSEDAGVPVARIAGVIVAVVVLIGIGTVSFGPARRAALDAFGWGATEQASVESAWSEQGVESHTPASPMVAGANGVRVQASPVDANIVASIQPGAVLSIDGRVVVDQTTWYRVSFADGDVGFVRSDFIQPLAMTIESYDRTLFVGADGANIRAGPRVDERVVGRLEPGVEIHVTGRLASGGWQWFRISHEGGVGFVREDVIETARVAEISSSQPLQLTPRVQNRLTTGPDGANVRSEPVTTARVLTRLPAFQALRVTGQSLVSGQTWYHIALDDGRTGYVRADVVQSASLAANAPPTTAINLRDIVWRRRASAEQMDRVYPRSARRQDGRVVLQCVARGDGRLHDCRVLTPDPRNADFSEAALDLIEYYRIEPVLRDNSRAEGRAVVVPIEFNYSEDAGRSR